MGREGTGTASIVDDDGRWEEVSVLVGAIDDVGAALGASVS